MSTSPHESDCTPAVKLMRNLGLEPDPWQIEVLQSKHPRLLLNCARQAGKSTVVALLALTQAIWEPGTQAELKVVLQALELDLDDDRTDIELKVPRRGDGD